MLIQEHHQFLRITTKRTRIGPSPIAILSSPANHNLAPGERNESLTPAVFIEELLANEPIANLVSQQRERSYPEAIERLS